MCGLVGTASTVGFKNRTLRQSFMIEGLAIDSFRGMESTGIALISSNEKEEPFVYKKAVAGWDFIQLNKANELLTNLEAIPVVIGHNRASTKGNVSDKNAHPFQFGHITLVHNGTVTNAWSLDGNTNPSGHDVDSAKVAYSMFKNGEMETLEKCEGGFTFVWWNSKERTLNIARNERKPLYMCYVEQENTMFWASEDTMLAHLLLKRDVVIDNDELVVPAPMIWHKYKLEDLRKVEKIPFAFKPRQGVVHSGGHNVRNFTPSHGPRTMSEHQADGWEKADEDAFELARGEDGPAYEAGEIDEIRRALSQQRGKDAKQSGIPTTAKRTQRAKVELTKLGIRYNELRVCTPLSWERYSNQRDYGSLLARMRRGGYAVEVISITHAEWVKYEKAGLVFVDCVNVRKGAKNTFRVVGVVSERTDAYLARRQAADAAPEMDYKGNSGSIARTYYGPGRQLVSLARFQDLVANNCGHCSGFVSPTTHDSILWYGSPEAPLCIVCSRDLKVLNELGISLSDAPKQAQVH